ncbi:MAG: DUF1826 domain-containing protein [Pseudomonadota bacterium]
MSATIVELARAVESGALEIEAAKRAAEGTEPIVLSEVYDENTNIVIWKRSLSSTLKQSVDEFLHSNQYFETELLVSPEKALSNIRRSFGSWDYEPLCEDIAEIVDMFCCLFDIERTGLRLRNLNAAMCPRFHTDKVPCRLVSTYSGVATDWLPHSLVDRSQLGPRSFDGTDLEAGLYRSEGDVQRLECGDVALLKGELWQGNAGAGLVHRSPSVTPGENRLLLTLDFCI